MSRVLSHLLLTLACGLLAPAAVAAQVRLGASSSNAWVGLPVTVTLEIENAANHDAPQLPDVTNAEVQSRGQVSNSTRLSIINGRRSQTQTVTYAWNLTPSAAGPVTVPAFRVRVDGADREIPGLTLDARAPDVGDRVFVQVSADHPEVYVGQPLELTLDVFIKAFTDERFNYAFSARNLWGQIDMRASRWGPFAKTLNDPARRGRAIEDDPVQRPDAGGQPADYFRYRIRARVYPDRAGPLELDGDGVRIVGQYPVALGRSRGLFVRDQLEVTEAQPIAVSAPIPGVRVKPVPTAGRPDTYRGAVGRYRITAAADPLSVAVGDAVTLQLMVLGSGPDASPLDRLSAPPLEAIETLTADFDVTAGPIAGVVRDGAKVFTTTIRPRRADVTAIPPIPFVSFDPETESFVTSESEPIMLAVRPAERLSLDGLADAPARAATSTSRPTDAGPAAQGWRPLPDTAPAAPAWPWFWPLLYAGLPAAAALARVAWWGVSRLRGREQAVASRAATRARRALNRAADAEGVAAALRRYAGDLTGRAAAALTAADARAALGAASAADAPSIDAFESALRDAEAAACGACPAPVDVLSRRGRAAIDGMASPARRRARPASVAAALLLLLVAAAAGGAPTPAPDPGSPRAVAERFEQGPPSGAALTHAAIAWNLSDEPARARAAALAAVRWDPASSAARAALADAERALGRDLAATAGFDRLTAHWLGWGGRRLVMAAGLAGLAGAGVAWGTRRVRRGRAGLIRGERRGSIAAGLALAAVGGGLSLHTALTVPAAHTAVLLHDEPPPRSGPGAGFAAPFGDDPRPIAGTLLWIIEHRYGWVRTPAGWLPADALATVDRTPRPPP